MSVQPPDLKETTICNTWRKAIHVRAMEPGPNGSILKTTPPPKAQKTLGERAHKDCLSQRSEFPVRLCLGATLEATPIKPYQHGRLNMS